MRVLLTDAAVKREPFADTTPRIVRDAKVAGLHLWVGKKKKTFRYQYEAPRTNGHRGATRVIALGEYPHHAAEDARAKALDFQARRARGEDIAPVDVAEPEVAPALTFAAAWALYKAALIKEAKSPRTIADYQDKFDRHLKPWHNRALGSIVREEVTKEHAAITERARKSRAGQKYVSGKYAANGTLRLARAVWNFAKNELETPGLPDRNPFRSGKLYHREKARETGMGAGDLAAWWQQVEKLPNPIRRELHLFSLLSGLRRNDVVTARWDHVDEQRKALRIPSPKGGEFRAFELPLSGPMLECLARVKEAGETFFPEQAKTWIFPADTGHIGEIKEDGKLNRSVSWDGSPRLTTWMMNRLTPLSPGGKWRPRISARSLRGTFARSQSQ